MNGLVSYKPTGSLNLWNDFDRVFDSFFTDVPVWKSRTPSVDVREEAERYVLEAELPGMTEKDVDVKIDENLLTISSAKSEEKSDEKKENGTSYLMRERSSFSFQRSFVLPKDVDKDAIKAKFKNGLLTLELAKSPELKPRSIEVKSE